MLEVGALMDPEEAQGRLVGNSIAVDEAFDLGAGDARELAYVGGMRAKTRGLGLARQRAEGSDQRLRFRVETLRSDRILALAETASEHHP
jgi:hypothetical protein